MSVSVRRTVLKAVTFSLCLLLADPVAGSGAKAAEATVAVAANFTATAKALAETFGKASGHQVILSFGSTGQLYAQISQGAPFDALLAADQARPAKLLKDGLAAAEPFTYATGRLALWSPDASTVPEDGAAFLASGALERLAIANPKLAPYGLAAQQSLTAMGLWERYKSHMVTGQNIAQAFQMTSSGAAPAGFVALSQVMAAPAGLRGSHWTVPAEMHDPIRQDAVLLKRGAGNAAAEGFLAYLTAPEGCAAILATGYAPNEKCK